MLASSMSIFIFLISFVIIYIITNALMSVLKHNKNNKSFQNRIVASLIYIAILYGTIMLWVYIYNQSNF